MKRSLRITIPEPPICWQRARTNKNRFYDPQWEVKKNLRIYVQETYLKPDFKLLDGPLEVNYHFYFKMPKSWSKKKTKAMFHKSHTNNKDLSNLMKFYEDTFNDFLCIDDRFIASSSQYKVWSDKDFTVMQISEIT